MEKVEKGSFRSRGRENKVLDLYRGLSGGKQDHGDLECCRSKQCSVACTYFMIVGVLLLRRDTNT